MPALDFDKWFNPPGPVTKWIIQTVDPSVTDLAAGDEVHFALVTAGTTIKISKVVCTHGGTHDGASWLTTFNGAGTLASGARQVTPKVSVRIQSSVTGDPPNEKHHLDCRSGSGASGSACWTADGG